MTQHPPQQDPVPATATPKKERTPDVRKDERSAPDDPATTPHGGARNDGEDLSPDDFE